MGLGLLPEPAPLRPEAATSQDGRVTLPMMICGAALLLFGVVKEGLGLAAQDFPLASAALLVTGTLSVCFVLFWNSHSLLRAQLRRLELERAQANRKQEEAAAAAHENARLLATMSHEIRTPLNGVIGMLGLLLDTELTAEQKNYAGIAHASGRTLLSIVDEILDRAKSEARNSEKTERVEIIPLIENVTELLAPRAHAKNIEISSHVAPDVPRHAPLRDLHLRQVLFNLAGNAIKFTQQGGIEIAVSRLSDAEFQIIIRDSGIGMTDQELARVFDAFQQANDETSRRFGGTGLGLHISRQLVAAMKGRLNVQSEPGRGTTFTLVLPTGAEPAEQPSPLLKGRRYALALAPGFAASHMCQSLAELGAETFNLETSPDAVRKAVQNLPAGTSIICDKTTADLLAAEVKSLERDTPRKVLPHLWIMIHPEDRRAMRHLLALPDTGYLVKPVRRSTLITQLTDSDHVQLAAATQQLRGVSRQQTAMRKMRLLLVDDTPVNAMLAKAMLAKEGHETVAVNSGRAALDLLAADRAFDLMLLDIEMAGLDGHETARALRAMEQQQGLAALPILALTAHVRPEDVEACLASGMDGHLAKPFDRQDLQDALRALARPQAA